MGDFNSLQKVTLVMTTNLSIKGSQNLCDWNISKSEKGCTIKSSYPNAGPCFRTNFMPFWPKALVLACFTQNFYVIK